MTALRRFWLLALLLPAGCYTPLPPHDYGPVGPFSLMERSERTVTKNDLLGKVWVASFVFTRCTGPCPQVTATMARLQQDFAGDRDVRLVTFTVDPERDDPKELTRYAGHFQADPERWLFLTGKEEAIHRLLREEFKLAVEHNKGKEVKPGDEFTHSTWLVVVDRRGHIRGYYDGILQANMEQTEAEFEDNLKALRRTVKALLQEAP
jgi:cytochrome oxidase Cu insertion factor (SCO1/SenC/PrrC family)